VNVDIDHDGATLRGRIDAGSSEWPSVRLERLLGAEAGAEWTCRTRNLALYALPLHCRELLHGATAVAPLPRSHQFP
jgi:hypothetical protein